MPRIQHKQLLVLTLDHTHRWLHLGQRTDGVLGPGDIEDGARDGREIDVTSPKRKLPPDHLVLLIKVVDPLPDRLAKEGDSITHPLAGGEQ